MRKPSFSLANFKKVRSDEAATVLQHPDGHEITINHATVRPEIKKQLDKLPVHKAEGGALAPPQLSPSEESDFAALKQQFMNNMAKATDLSGGGFTPEQIDRQSTELAHEKLMAQRAQMQSVQGTPADALAQDAAKAQREQEGAMWRARMEGPGNPPPAGQVQIPQSRQIDFGHGAPPLARLASVSEPTAEVQAAPTQAEGPKNLDLGQGQPQEDVPPAEPQRVENPYELERRAAQEYSKHLQEIQKSTEQAVANTQGEIQKTIEDIKQNHINPNAYMENMGVGQKIATAIGLILGGAGSGLTHSENMAARWLENQIQRNVDAQKASLGQKNTLLDAYMRQYGNLKSASEMALATQHALVAAKFQEAAAMSNDPLYKQKAMQNYMQFMQKANALGQGVAARQGVRGANVPPEMKIVALQQFGMLTPQEATKAHEELKNMQVLNEGRKDAMHVFQEAAKEATVLGALSPRSHARLEALIQPVILKLARDTAGRVSEYEMKQIATLMPARTDDLSVLMTKFRALDRLTREKMHSPLLTSHGIEIQPYDFVMQNTQTPAVFRARR